MSPVLTSAPRGAQRGERRGSRDTKVDRSVPPWRAWRTRSRAARAIRFVETYCRIPSGHNAGELMKLHRFQKESLEELLAEGVRTGGLQIPRGNAKSTLWAAVGLWALCDHPDVPQVPLVAFNGKQATRNLLEPVAAMVRGHPDLVERVIPYTSSTDRRVYSAWNEGSLVTLPADTSALQGLNPTIALVDEAQTIPLDVFTAVLQGAGKRAASLVLAIGTPAPNAQTSALYELRARAATGDAIRWVEYAADDGCAIDDRRQWAKANPAIRAGLLDARVLEDELTTVPEALFRVFRLGQWIDATITSWLPGAAWDDCPHADPPEEGTEVVLGLAGTYASTFALVGCTLDGAMFAVWLPDYTPSEAELETLLAEAFDRWQVVELAVQARILTSVVRRLQDAPGPPVYVWENTVAHEAESATAWRRAIVEGRAAHDHDPDLAPHIAATVGTSTPDGSLRLTEPEGVPASGARAARMAWWRALELETAGGPVIY